MTSSSAINRRTHLSNQELELKATIVSADADRAIEGERFWPQISLSNLAAINRDSHLSTRQLYEQGVGAARTQPRHGRRTLRSYVSITVIPALGTGMHAGVTFDANDELGLWLNAPHCIHEIARIVATPLPRGRMCASGRRCGSRASKNRLAVAPRGGRAYAIRSVKN